MIGDFELTAADADEREAAHDMLTTHPGRTYSADKGYVNAALAVHLQEAAGVRLIALRCANQREPLPEALAGLISRFRQIIETVNGHVDD